MDVVLRTLCNCERVLEGPVLGVRIEVPIAMPEVMDADEVNRLLSLHWSERPLPTTGRRVFLYDGQRDEQGRRVYVEQAGDPGPT